MIQCDQKEIVLNDEKRMVEFEEVMNEEIYLWGNLK